MVTFRGAVPSAFVSRARLAAYSCGGSAGIAISGAPASLLAPNREIGRTTTPAPNRHTVSLSTTFVARGPLFVACRLISVFCRDRCSAFAAWGARSMMRSGYRSVRRAEPGANLVTVWNSSNLDLKRRSELSVRQKRTSPPDRARSRSAGCCGQGRSFHTRPSCARSGPCRNRCRCAC